MSTPTELERENLEAHVDLCALRYEQMEKRLELMDERFDRIDERLDDLSKGIKRNNTQIIVALLGATATIVGSMIAVLASVL